MKATEKAYIAGFLDGDGSIHIRLKPNESYKFGFQVAPSVIFYQSKKEIRCMRSIKNILKLGYIRTRNDGIVEFIIGDTESMLKIIKLTLPYLRFKKKQALLFREILLQKKNIKNANNFYNLCKKIDSFEKLNYSKKRKQNSIRVKKYLLEKGLLTP